MVTFTKDKDAQLDFTFDWSRNLPADDTIASADVTVPAGLTKVHQEVTTDGRGVVVWLSGGTAGDRYEVRCRMTSAAAPGRIDDATFSLLIVER